MVLSVQTLLSWIGAAGLSVLAVTFAAFGLFKWLGKKWLEQKFEEGLERFKQENRRELESWRAQLSTRLDRATILNQREFDILPKLYSKLVEAYGSAANFTSAMQSFADVDRLDEAELEDLLEEHGFKEFEKKEIKSAQPRSSAYQERLFWKRLNEASSVYREFHLYLLSNSILIDRELETGFSEASDLMWDALNEAKYEKRYPNPRKGRWAKRDALQENGRKMVDEIRDEVRKRLGNLTSLQEAKLHE